MVKVAASELEEGLVWVVVSEEAVVLGGGKGVGVGSGAGSGFGGEGTRGGILQQTASKTSSKSRNQIQ